MEHMDTSMEMAKHYPRLWAILLVLSAMFHLMANITLDGLYNIAYRSLSIIAVIFAIIVNWPKVKEMFLKSMKKKSKKK